MNLRYQKQHTHSKLFDSFNRSDEDGQPIIQPNLSQNESNYLDNHKFTTNQIQARKIFTDDKKATDGNFMTEV